MIFTSYVLLYSIDAIIDAPGDAIAYNRRSGYHIAMIAASSFLLLDLGILVFAFYTSDLVTY